MVTANSVIPAYPDGSDGRVLQLLAVDVHLDSLFPLAQHALVCRQVRLGLSFLFFGFLAGSLDVELFLREGGERAVEDLFEGLSHF